MKFRDPFPKIIGTSAVLSPSRSPLPACAAPARSCLCRQSSSDRLACRRRPPPKNRLPPPRGQPIVSRTPGPIKVGLAAPVDDGLELPDGLLVLGVKDGEEGFHFLVELIGGDHRVLQVPLHRALRRIRAPIMLISLQIVLLSSTSRELAMFS